MKIATWNVERLKHKYKLNQIISLIDEVNADILVLTEADIRVRPSNFKYEVRTQKLSKLDDKNYKETEHRISIFTNYEILKEYKTFDKFTSLCVELETKSGKLLVYCTIIGIYGNRDKNFNLDLTKQIIDFCKLSNTNNLCIIGDYIISFSDNYYFTNYGRNKLNNYFTKNNIELITRNSRKCIDHIAFSKQFIEKMKIELKEFNIDKKLSDHKGILTILTE